jgi:hypothetical protein
LIVGTVLDLSRHGLRIALPVALPVNSMLQIRADNAPPETPWVKIIVRNSRRGRKCFEHGCELAADVPLYLRLSFG